MSPGTGEPLLGAPAGTPTRRLEGVVRICQVTNEQLNAAEHSAAVRDRTAGADVSFAGVVRDHDHGRQVVELEYTAYPTAVDVLREVCDEISANPDVIAIAVSHRIGPLQIGDVALMAAVSCAHRGSAFVECARLVDLVKERLPVWKRQVFDDGSDEWVNCP